MTAGAFTFIRWSQMNLFRWWYLLRHYLLQRLSYPICFRTSMFYDVWSCVGSGEQKSYLKTKICVLCICIYNTHVNLLISYLHILTIKDVLVRVRCLVHILPVIKHLHYNNYYLEQHIKKFVLINFIAYSHLLL